MTDLVERLRKRAESEREIQRNNEAVADALEAQLDAFKRRDGTHNNFAVRLGLDHRSCAKKDAALAKDWDEAADALEAAQAQAAEVRRETIAKCADIARCAFDDRPRIRAGNVDWSDGYDEATRAAEAAIRALTDAAKGDRT